MRDNPDVQAIWDAAIATMTDPVDPEFVRDFQQRTLVQPVSDAFFDGVIRESLKVPTHVRKATFARLVTAIPGAKLLIYPDAGHALHWEYPDRFAADLQSFWNSQQLQENNHDSLS